MAPTILTDATGLRLVVGTPGGATIITSVAQIIAGHFERGCRSWTRSPPRD